MKPVLLIILMLLAGCRSQADTEARNAAHAATAQERREADWEQARYEVATRARIDLNCAEVQVALVSEHSAIPTEVSAQGCGLSALYHRQLRRHFGRLSAQNTTWERVAV